MAFGEFHLKFMQRRVLSFTTTSTRVCSKGIMRTEIFVELQTKGRRDATKTENLQAPSFSEKHVAIFSNYMFKKPRLKVQNLQHKFLDWKWPMIPPPPLELHPFLWRHPSLSGQAHHNLHDFFLQIYQKGSNINFLESVHDFVTGIEKIGQAF